MNKISKGAIGLCKICKKSLLHSDVIWNMKKNGLVHVTCNRAGKQRLIDANMVNRITKAQG